MEILKRRRREKCPKLDDVLNYWPHLIEGMNFSTKEFYERAEAALDARQIPDLEMTRVDINEGGPMSARREYLRLRRERLVYDICAMPFGTGFYVSGWFYQQPRRVGLILVAILCAISVIGVTIATGPGNDVYRFFYRSFGMYRDQTTKMLIGVPLLLAFVGIVVGVLWFGEAVDGILLRIPLIGWIYEKRLRRVTYYREDRTCAFNTAVHAAVCCVIDGICKTQGIAPLSDAAKRPTHPQIKPNIGPFRGKPPMQPVG